jgi:N-acetylglucosaminyldiphosphoundecaprenol N-acetyl-beta-D-mannosaminyltransferase
MRDHGLEWLFRLSREPRRLWRRYFVTNTGFLIAIARSSIHKPMLTILPKD